MMAENTEVESSDDEDNEDQVIKPVKKKNKRSRNVYNPDETDYESASEIEYETDNETDKGAQQLNYARGNPAHLVPIPMSKQIPLTIQKKQKPIDKYPPFAEERPLPPFAQQRPLPLVNNWTNGPYAGGKKYKSKKNRKIYNKNHTAKKTTKRLRKTHKNTKRPKYIKKNVTKRRR
jgi:hypothetical protein